MNKFLKRNVFLIISLLLLIFSSCYADPNILFVHFLDVGQADCILIQSPGGHNMLIDAGNNGDAKTITKYLNKLKIKKLDVVVGTHPHEDHIGALDTVIKTYSIGQVYLPRVSTNTKTFKDLLLAIKNKGLKVNTAKAGVNIDLDPALKTVVMAPKKDKYEELNNYSAVIKLTYDKVSFLFAGDAEELSESEMLLSSAVSPKADVLKVGHHGSSSSTSPPFLSAVAPKYAVISVGKKNKYKHPDQEIIDRLKETCEVLRTDKNGTIIMKTDGFKIDIITEKKNG